MKSNVTATNDTYQHLSKDLQVYAIYIQNHTDFQNRFGEQFIEILFFFLAALQRINKIKIVIISFI